MIKKHFISKLILICICAILLTMSFMSANSVFASGGGNGVDPILESVGLEKPDMWKDWNREKKHKFLQDRGIFPESGDKYKGKADTTGFFEWLGVEKPADWESKTFDEKKEFVTENTTDEELSIEEEVGFQIDASNIISSALAIFIMFGGIFKKKNIIRKSARFLAIYALPLILGLIAIVYYNTATYIEMGRWAERILIFLLFVKPLSSILPQKIFKREVTFRQELGVASFWFFIVHAIGFIVLRGIGISDYAEQAYLILGAIAGVGMVLLAITSNKFSMKLLKRNWKRLQRLSYVVLFLVLAHSSLVLDGNLNKLYVIGAIFLVLKILQWKKVKLFSDKNHIIKIG